MKRLTLFTFMLSFMMVGWAANYDFDEYIYPFGFRTYASPDSKGNLSSVTQYSFESQAYDNYLVEEVYIGMGIMSAKTIYRYHTEDNKVISDVQLRQNRLTGTTHYQDKLTLFAFPKDDKPFKWMEIDRGDKYLCTSEYVYINVSLYHNSSFIKAIKITRDNSYVVGKEKHRVIEKSYWASGYGRLITLINWDGAERISSKLDVLDYYQEMSTEEYKMYLKKREDAKKRQQEEEALLRKKQEEEALLKRQQEEKEALLKKQREEAAILRRKIEKFNKEKKPQSFDQKYPNYQQDVVGVIESLVTTLDSIGTEPLIVTVTSSKDIVVEKGAFNDSPKIGTAVKTFVMNLLRDKKITLETIINPETNEYYEIPLILKVTQIPVIETQDYSLDYINGMWYEKGGKKPFYRSSATENEIYQAAEKFLLTNKKAKRVTVVAKYVKFNNHFHFKEVEEVRIRK